MKFNRSAMGTINLHKSAWICGANEPPRSKLRGIKGEFAEANPPSLFKLRRVRPAIHPRSKLQGILAKANKSNLPVPAVDLSYLLNYWGNSSFALFSCQIAVLYG